MNANCVITNEETDQKYVLAARFYSQSVGDRPGTDGQRAQILTACGMVDTISHVLRSISTARRTRSLQDRLAEGVVQTVLESTDVLERPATTLRGVLAWASSLALCGLCDSGRGLGAFDAHTIELEISAL